MYKKAIKKIDRLAFSRNKLWMRVIINYLMTEDLGSEFVAGAARRTSHCLIFVNYRKITDNGLNIVLRVFTEEDWLELRRII